MGLEAFPLLILYMAVARHLPTNGSMRRPVGMVQRPELSYCHLLACAFIKKSLILFDHGFP